MIFFNFGASRVLVLVSVTQIIVLSSSWCEKEQYRRNISAQTGEQKTTNQIFIYLYQVKAETLNYDSMKHHVYSILLPLVQDEPHGSQLEFWNTNDRVEQTHTCDTR